MIQGYLTTSEAAGVLGVTDSRIRQLILEKELKAEKIGGKTLVIRLSSIERYQRRKTNGKRKAA